MYLYPFKTRLKHTVFHKKQLLILQTSHPLSSPKEQMKISIVIPIYNVESHIERCLQSVLNQTYQNIEIILIDDAGTDNSMEVVNKTLTSHRPLQNLKILKHETNRGLSAARNTGINNATGEYIYFMDSDDEITLNCVEKLAVPAIKFKPDFVISDYQTIGSNVAYPPLNLKEGKLNSNRQILISYLNNDWYMMAWNKLINKTFLIDNNLYFKENLLHEDNLWSFQLACKAQSAYIIKDKTYNYFIQVNSITQSPSVKNLNSYLEIIEDIVQFIKNEGLDEDYEIYNFIETLKSIFFYKINSSDTSEKFKFDAYKRIRESNYKCVFLYLVKYKLIKSRIKTRLHSTFLIHYLLPIKSGFSHYIKSTSRFYK